MKTLTKVLLSLALFLMPSLAFGQTALVATTTTGAITKDTNTFGLTSATGVTVNNNTYNTVLYINRELMTVIRISGTTVTVIRGVGGSQASAHPSGATVWVAPAAGAIFNFDPEGTCTGAGAIQYTPWINQRTSQTWICSKAGTWAPGFGNPGVSGTPPKTSADVASTAGAILPSGPVFHVTGTSAVTGFTVPAGFRSGYCFMVISDGAWTWTNAGNIAISSTATQTGTTVTFCYDSTATKPFYPSHL